MKFAEAEKVIKVLTGSGKYISLIEWQEKYGLQRGSAQIGKHFTYTESRFTQDIEQFGELIVCAPLMYVLDEFRKRVKRCVRINSFNRTDEYQKGLKERGLKAATFSPHVVKLAADIDTSTPEQTRDEVKILLEAAKSLNIPIRIGYEQYLANKQTFIHVDVCPEYFGKGKVWHDLAHPKAWEYQLTW
jgi:hypothetical protein